jgi:pyrimidine operon attenuation protein/uracil phosphoribosyltransferase
LPGAARGATIQRSIRGSIEAVGERSGMPSAETILLDAAALNALVDDLAREIARGRTGGIPIRLVGIRTRGVPIAERLAARLGAALGEPIPVGAVDITLYRDDLNLRQSWPVLHGTEIPFRVEGADVVLVDDVLYTGRTVRAALNTVCDLGRPARVRLAVVVDRGGREFPIRADHVGAAFAVDHGERVLVRIAPIDPTDCVVRIPRS